ncbi:hypothetical protein T439DRAFT_356718 [Meredithblackwellia eburnea MCA 4105]
MAGVGDEEVPQFKLATIDELFKHSIDPNTRISDAALQLSAEYLRAFATEAIHRSADVARKEAQAKEKKEIPVIEVRPPRESELVFVASLA